MHAALDADAYSQPAATPASRSRASPRSRSPTPARVRRRRSSASPTARRGRRPTPPTPTSPSPRDTGGDVWFDHVRPAAGRRQLRRPTPSCTRLGHALGLKHGHDDGVFGRAAGGRATRLEFIGDDLPQSYVGADARRLQRRPGRLPADLHDARHRRAAAPLRRRLHHQRRRHHLLLEPGAPARTLVDGARGASRPPATASSLTIWDGGGIDTYDLSAYADRPRASTSRPGAHSTFAAAQLADLGGGPNGGHARGNLFNALQYQGDPRSLIENASGGSGDDRSAATPRQPARPATPATTALDRPGRRRRRARRRRRRRLPRSAAPAPTSLIGGAGRDRFDFAAARESPPATRDACDVGDARRPSTRPRRGPSGDRDRPLRRSTPTPAAPATRPSSSAAAAQGHLRLLDRGGTTRLGLRQHRRQRRAPSFELRIADGAHAAPADLRRARRLHPLGVLRLSRRRIRYAWHGCPRSACADQRVPGLGAEVRDVDQRRRVVGQHPQHRARRQRRRGACAPSAPAAGRAARGRRARRPRSWRRR